MSSAPNRNPVLTQSQATNKPFPVAIQKSSADQKNKEAAALSDRFTIIKPTGASEDAKTYLALDRNSGSTVTLKTLSTSAAADPSRLKLFYLESHAAARLAHDNIVKTSEAARLGNSHSSIIEFDGEAKTLRAMLDQTGWLDIDQATNIARQIVRAIEYAHSKGIWHLKICPEEILIESSGMARLTGFGIESDSELIWAHKERTRVCQARYVSPEQAGGDNIDHRADLYAFGIVLFEMLTDRVPFDSHEADGIRQKHLSRIPEPPTVYREGIPESLSDLVMDLLEKNPDRRIKKVTSYQSLLNRLCEANPVVDSSDRNSQEMQSNLTAIDFLPFGLQTDDQNVIDVEMIAQPDTLKDSMPAEIESTEPLISLYESPVVDNLNAVSGTPIYESSQPNSAYGISELVLNNISGREAFEPPTISAMDVPLDQNYDCTPEARYSNPATVRLLPEIIEEDDRESLALSVRRIISLPLERFSKTVMMRRAIMIIAGVVLVTVPLVFMQRSQPANTQNAAQPPTVSKGTVAAPLPNAQNSVPSNQSNIANTTGQNAGTTPSPRRTTRVRSTAPVRKVRKSQSRSRRSQPARRSRRARR